MLKKFPNGVKKFNVKEKIPLENKPQLMNEIVGLQNSLSGVSRLLVRYSGTEPKIRLLVEGEDMNEVNQCLENLKNTVFTHLNVLDIQ